jgi:hypothetical protein
MSDEEQRLCDVCHERPARHHSRNPAGETKHFCRTCFEQNASAAELESFLNVEKLLRTGKCKYCGGPPGVAKSDWLNIPGLQEKGLQEKVELLCEQCARDLAEFRRQPENAMPSFPFEDEAAQDLASQQLTERERHQQRKKSRERRRAALLQQQAERERRQQEYMQQKIRERSK